MGDNNIKNGDQPVAGWRSKEALLSLLLLATLAAGSGFLYHRSLDNGLTVDDPYLLTMNADMHRFGAPDVTGRPQDSQVQNGDLRSYLHFFKHNYFHGVQKGDDFLYRPLVLCTLGWDYRRIVAQLTPEEKQARQMSIAGTGAWTPPAHLRKLYHQTNLYLYTGLILLLYLFLLLLFRSHPGRQIIAACGAGLFLVFPAHTEAVCNIKGREEILALGFSLLAWAAWEGWVTCQNRLKPLGLLLAPLSAVFFLLALWCKESTLAFGAAMWLWYAFFRSPQERGPGFIRQHLLPYWGFVLASGAWFVSRTMAVGMHLTAGGELFFEPGEGFFTRLFTSAKVFVQYYIFDALATQEIHPDLSSRYLVSVESAAPSLWAWACVGVLGGILCLGAWLCWKGRRLAAYWLLFFFWTFLTTSNFLVGIGSIGAFRFLFTPSLSYCVLAGLAVTAAIRYSRSAAALGVIAMASLLGYYTTATLKIQPAWDSVEMLNLRCMQLDHRNPRCSAALGTIFLETAEVDLARAREAARKARRSGREDDWQTFAEAQVKALRKAGKSRAFMERALALWESDPERIRGQERLNYALTNGSLVNYLLQHERRMVEHPADPEHGDLPWKDVETAFYADPEKAIGLCEKGLKYVYLAAEAAGERVSYAGYKQELHRLHALALMAGNRLTEAVATLKRGQDLMRVWVQEAEVPANFYPVDPAQLYLLEGEAHRLAAGNALLSYFENREPETHARLERLRRYRSPDQHSAFLAAFQTTTESGPSPELTEATQHYNQEREVYQRITELKQLPAHDPGIRLPALQNYANTHYALAWWYHQRGQHARTEEALEAAYHDLRQMRSSLIPPRFLKPLLFEFDLYQAREYYSSGQYQAVLGQWKVMKDTPGYPGHRLEMLDLLDDAELGLENKPAPDHPFTEERLPPSPY